MAINLVGGLDTRPALVTCVGLRISISGNFLGTNWSIISAENFARPARICTSCDSKSSVYFRAFGLSKNFAGMNLARSALKALHKKRRCSGIRRLHPWNCIMCISCWTQAPPY